MIDRPFTVVAIGIVATATGSAAGGAMVTITGTALDGVCAVYFASTRYRPQVVSATELRVKTPAGQTGSVKRRPRRRCR
ncbi:IPT/TIG domain-containing protein [Streptomyces pilosus]|uniref:IPT/TIG domain-containing protein n=1 Tax=Streptomyces pilosus TaxID=28893 RepID=UPI0036353EE7